MALELTLRPSSLLALLSDHSVAGGRAVPHTRSVLVGRAAGGGLALVEGLEFRLYLATADAELDGQALHKELTRAYASERYSRKALAAASGALQTQRRESAVLFPGAEARWAEALARGEEVADLLPGVPAEAAPALLAQFRRAAAVQVALKQLEANAALFRQYRQLEEMLATVALLQEEMQAPDFFPIKHFRQWLPSKLSPLPDKLKGARVWCLTLENHAALEYYVRKLRYPLEMGGQWFPERRPGRQVALTVLEMDPALERLQLCDRSRQENPHLYSLAQLPRLAPEEAEEAVQLRWAESRALHLGLLSPALASVQAEYAEAEGEDVFARLQACASRNDLRCAGNACLLQLGELGAEVRLVSYGARERPQEPPALRGFRRERAEPAPLALRAPQKKESAADKKRKAEAEADRTSTAVKKIKWGPAGKRQATLPFGAALL